ncbi:DUF4291 domain-containing protein [Emticicia sp. C21]|uniref:DUF4291 domain-containing protein n=1 Tax=Emticicia sp. C21 TaxID=2302915 RepID=UPI000E34FC00|nr:DUF4291 domain-containing protein [Emticicia sp. C21]RFS15694.1 DUF4291 domain-containing protein [Emticicia sp. C21]
MKSGSYIQHFNRLPKEGKYVIGQKVEDNIIVYQAFNPSIARYAIIHQKFGGEHYSFNRMSWIKPGFLWMMHRAGWASKDHQQHILAITISQIHFEEILKQATISSFDDALFDSREKWQQELAKTQVRLQWDPDHDPYGNKIARKAIQLGLKGEILRKFCTDWIIKIDDITPFVKEQYEYVKSKRLDALQVPVEEVIEIMDESICKRIGINITN